ncbi:MAG: tetratricopeptide repeat protein [Holophagaceae bacterium]|nr:tetratricopeptide repeat protein [Holophagaceae bacterium]
MRLSSAFVLGTLLSLAGPAARGQADQAPAAVQAPDKATFDEARRHLVRGAAAIEMAKNDGDLALAADEFQKAVTIYPGWAFAWMNLGQVQARLGRLPEAMASYKRFLALAPEDKEAGKVGDELIKLEFRLEQSARIRNRGGIWVGEAGMPFLAKAEGNSLVLKTARQRMSARELDANEFMGGEAGIPVREFRLELQGTKVTGTSTRSEVVAGKCTVPAETVEVEGSYDEGAGRLILKMPRTRFQSRTSVNLFLDPVDCRGVTSLGKEEVQVVLLGPLPEGGIGIPVDLAYLPGGVLIRHEWQGHLGVGSYTAPLTDRAKSIGFQKMDEIVSIDGVAIKGLAPTEVIRRLRGPVGSEVILGVLRKKAKEPETLKVTRVPVAPPAADRPYVYEVWVN